MPRPSIAWWDAEGKMITIAGKQIVLSKWINYVHKKLDDVSELIESNVLMSVLSLEEINSLYDLPNLPATTVLGQGIFFDATNTTFDNPESIAFLGKLLSAKKLGAHVQIGLNNLPKIVFDKELAIKWVIDIHRVWMIVQPLAYILQGPGGRLTEECAYSPINNEIGPANIIAVPGKGTGGFYSRYHKSLSVTGQFKHIIRLVPYQVFQLLYILIRIIRPIELVVLYDYIIPFDQQQATTNAYKDHVFASYGRAWTPEFSSAALLAFTRKSEMGFSMGVREFRHFSIAVQRQKLNYKGASYNPNATKMSAAADAMAAHTPAVAEYHYARLEGAIGTASQDELFMQVSCDWHQVVYGVPTSKSDTEKAAKTKKDPETEKAPVIPTSPLKLPRRNKCSSKSKDTKKTNYVTKLHKKFESSVIAIRNNPEQRPLRTNIARKDYKAIADEDSEDDSSDSNDD